MPSDSPPVKASGAVQPEHKQSGSINGVKAKDENGAHAETYKIVLCNHALIRTKCRYAQAFGATDRTRHFAKAQPAPGAKVGNVAKFLK